MSEETPEPTPPTATPFPPGVNRVMGMALPKFEHAVQKAAAGERVVWDVYLMGAPSPTQMGRIETGLAFFMAIPAPIPGRSYNMATVIDTSIYSADQKVVDEFVRGALDQLLGARSQGLMEQEAQNAAANGQPPAPASPGGLYLPGQG